MRIIEWAWILCCAVCCNIYRWICTSLSPIKCSWHILRKNFKLKHLRLISYLQRQIPIVATRIICDLVCYISDHNSLILFTAWGCCIPKIRWITFITSGTITTGLAMTYARQANRWRWCYTRIFIRASWTISNTSIENIKLK